MNNNHITDRNREIVTLKESGKSYSQLGSQFGLSRGRVREIYLKEKRKAKGVEMHTNAVNGDIPYSFYDALVDVCETSMQVTRIYTCLLRAGIINEIEKNHGSLDSYSDESLLNIRNFGTISLIFARRAYKQYKESKDLNN